MEFATRDGVLSRPSRFGSSPISSSSRRTSSSNSLLSCVFDIIVFGLPQDEPCELTGFDLGKKYFPERDDDVLGRRNHALHEWDVEIEILVIDYIDDLALDDLLEVGQVT